MNDPVLWKAPSGIFKIRVYDGAKRVLQQSCKTRDWDRAQLELAKFKGAWNGSLDGAMAPPPLEDFIKECESYYLTNLGSGTWKNYRTALRALLEAVGNIPLDRVDFTAIERFKASRRANKVVPKTINGNLLAISSALSLARDKGYIKAKPRLRYLKLDRDVVKPYLVEAEIRRLLEEAQDSPALYSFCFIALHTGMRPGEVCRLTADDIDLTNAVIHVRRTKSRRDRTIPIHPELANFFAGSDRVPLPGYLAIFRRFRKVVLKLGWRNITPHTLRHTFASHKAQQGVALDTLRRWMGHAKLDTLQIYTHLRDDASALSMARLPGVLR